MLLSALRGSIHYLQVRIRHVVALTLVQISRRIAPGEAPKPRDEPGDGPPAHWLEDIQRLGGEPHWMSFVAPSLGQPGDEAGYARFRTRTPGGDGTDTGAADRRRTDSGSASDSVAPPANPFGARKEPGPLTEHFERRPDGPPPLDQSVAEGDIRLRFPRKQTDARVNQSEHRERGDRFHIQEPAPGQGPATKPRDIRLRYGSRPTSERAHATISDAVHGRETSSPAEESSTRREVSGRPGPSARPNETPGVDSAPTREYDTASNDRTTPGLSRLFTASLPDSVAHAEPKVDEPEHKRSVPWTAASSDPVSEHRPVHGSVFSINPSTVESREVTGGRRWPELPKNDAPSSESSILLDELERRRSEWKRRARLNSEQRGTEWSESPS